MRIDEQRSFAAGVGELVDEVVNFARQFGETADADPLAGSRANQELNHHEEVGPRGPWGRKPVEDAYNVAALLYGGAGQYLRALRQLLHDDMVLFGFQAITRALLEAAARSWWILDPECSVRQRVERAYEERYYSFSELQKVADTAGGDLARQVANDTRLRVEAAELGLQERTEKNLPLRRPLGVGTPRPSSTDLVSALLSHVGVCDGKVWYRTFSGVVHSALYSQVGYWEPVLMPGSQRYQLEPQLPMTAIANGAVLSIAGYLGAIERHAMLYGRDCEQLEAERLSAITRITALHDSFVGS